MIASVRGEVLVRRPDHVVIESGGVGYRLTVSAETLKAVPARGKHAALHAHLVARDDTMSLYGFGSEEERDLFLNLTSVSGIGKRTAERVIVELREKVAGELEEGVALGAAADGEEDPRLLAREGLMHLGYTLTEAERLLAGAEGGSAEELISVALRRGAEGVKA